MSKAWEGGLGDPDTYDKYVENGCPTCGADVGVAGMFWWCDDGHFGVVNHVK